MATGKQIRDRIFAMSGAILFFVSASALTVAVIISNVQDKKAKPADPTTSQTSCPQSVDGQTALAAPEVFKPDADITELQTTDLVPGSGDAAKNGDCLIMKYYGTLASDGTLFDENYTKTTGFGFTLGGGQVIKGWDQGLVGMKAGGERRLVIPSDLAYGESGQGSIPANADLVFVVTLIKIQK